LQVAEQVENYEVPVGMAPNLVKKESRFNQPRAGIDWRGRRLTPADNRFERGKELAGEFPCR